MLPGNAKCSVTSLADTKHTFMKRFMAHRILEPIKNNTAKIHLITLLANTVFGFCVVITSLFCLVPCYFITLLP